jgi:hypothetical protein
MSMTLAIGASNALLKQEVLRGQFNELPLISQKSPKNHTHGDAAADRSGASTFIDQFAALTGLTAYFVQQSSSDQRKGRQGSRGYYWSKDLTVTSKSFNLPENPLFSLVDVDQYLDMPSTLASQFVPTLLYTFQPSQVARSNSNYSYTFNGNNEVDYKVSGGGHYTHEVWNYGTDHVLLTNTIFGVPYRAAAFLVDRRSSSKDHELILLTPVKKWRGPFAILASYLYGKPLTRLKPVQGDFLRLELQSHEGIQRSTGRVGCFAQALISAQADDTIAAINRTSKMDLTMPQVLQFVDGDKEAAACLLEYHRTQVTAKPDVIYPVKESIRTYQFEPLNYEPSVKPMLVPFMSPFLYEAYVPANTESSERHCVKGRILDVRSKTLELTPFLSKVMHEFLDLMMPIPHKLHPVDDDYVYDKQHKPSQRRILEQSETVVEPQRNIQMFMKKEAYGEIKDPRPISQINGTDKREYSKFIYPLSEYIKTLPWYAFGKTPLETAHRVAEVVLKALWATNSDFSKFDGHVSNLVRHFEKLLFLRAYGIQYHPKIFDLHGSQFNLSVFSRLGIKYFLGTARASGSPETATFNSLFNAFVAYLGFRLDKSDGSFCDPMTAYSNLGIYGGDDGLTADIDPKTYVRAAAMLGQVLTVETVSRGQFGIKFLARVYGPDVWFGDVDSCCDLPRQLAKFHTTVSLETKVSPEIKLMEKCRSFYLTDENTPIIGEFVVTAIEVYGGIPERREETRSMEAWASDVPKTEQYPNSRSGWMMDYLEKSIPNFDYKRFKLWIGQANTLGELMSPPLCVEPTMPKPKVPVVLEGNVIGPGTEKNGPAWKKEPVKKSAPRRSPKNNEKKGEIPDRNHKPGGRARGRGRGR